MRVIKNSDREGRPPRVLATALVMFRPSEGSGDIGLAPLGVHGIRTKQGGHVGLSANAQPCPSGRRRNHLLKPTTHPMTSALAARRSARAGGHATTSTICTYRNVLPTPRFE